VDEQEHIVLEDGRIIESGTHDELVHRGGTYARLFETQAQYYNALSLFGGIQMDGKTEGELLLYCLGIRTDEIRAAKLERLSTADWDEFIQQSVRHGVTPLLYQRLETLGSSTNIPAGIVQRLREIYLHSAARNMRLYHELEKVFRILQNEDIPVILLKGVALAETVYQNRALRSMGDVDFLVKKEDLYRTEITLLNLGYTVPERYLKIKWDEKNHHHLAPYVKENGIMVEVHRNIERPSSPFQIEIDGMWERARLAKIANVEVLVLSPEDLILHLCLHASFHHEFRIGLMPICDISETIQHYQNEIDWKQLLSTVNEYGISKFIYCTLSLTKKMLGTEIPDDVLTELKPDTFDPQLINLAEERILSKTSSQVPPSVVDAFSPEKLIDKLKATLKYLFPSRSSVATRFPVSENSIFLYPFYLAYPFNFILRRWQFLWRLTKRDKAILSEFKQAVAQKRRAEILERWLSS